MADSEQGKSFWATIPGMLTGLAAVLTAFTGLYLALHQKSSTDTTEPPKVTTSATTPGNSGPATSPVNTAGATITPAAIASVTVTSRTGDVSHLTSKSFQHNSTEKSQTLMSGQNIAFDKISSIDFGTWDSNAHTVDVKITLVDGRVIPGDVDSRYAYLGQSDLGEFTIFVSDTKRIVFNR